MLLHHFKILLNRTLEPYRIDRCCFLGYIRFAFRAIAQLVSVRVWGARGPGFEFRLPDLKAVQLWTAFFYTTTDRIFFKCYTEKTLAKEFKCRPAIFRTYSHKCSFGV